AGLAKYLATGEGPVLNQMIEITAVRKDGSEFPIELTITPLQVESGMMFSAFVRDITARKQMVERLNEREMFFRLLSEQLPVGVFEVNAAGACLYTNKMWELICRGHGGQAGHRKMAAAPSKSWTQWFHVDDRPVIEAAWAKTTSAYVPIQHECRLAGGGEEAQWIQVLLWPMVTETGVRYLGTIEDITARKRTIAHTMQLLREGRFELQTLSEAKHLAELLAYAFPDPARAQLGITELLVNGVEHGNLDISYDEKTGLLEQGKLDEELARRLALPDYARRRVRVTTARTDTELRLAIVDEGKGFDWSQYLDPGREPSGGSHGRGIAMSKLISFDHLEYRDRGNHVVVTTRLAGPPAGSEAPEQAQAA
ncbi:MAG TPA: PAS domain S-box protein, partial [Bryobacteraceae bacterium]|nr:PAS domain S-box protein [Bryobacteraceae bacterium]